MWVFAKHFYYFFDSSWHHLKHENKLNHLDGAVEASDELDLWLLRDVKDDSGLILRFGIAPRFRLGEVGLEDSGLGTGLGSEWSPGGKLTSEEELRELSRFRSDAFELVWPRIKMFEFVWTSDSLKFVSLEDFRDVGGSNSIGLFILAVCGESWAGRFTFPELLLLKTI